MGDGELLLLSSSEGLVALVLFLFCHVLSLPVSFFPHRSAGFRSFCFFFVPLHLFVRLFRSYSLLSFRSVCYIRFFTCLLLSWILPIHRLLFDPFRLHCRIAVLPVSPLTYLFHSPFCCPLGRSSGPSFAFRSNHSLTRTRSLSMRYPPSSSSSSVVARARRSQYSRIQFVQVIPSLNH